jgi:hypothetical protein
MAKSETDDRVKRIILRQLEIKLSSKEGEESTYEELLENAMLKYTTDANMICGRVLLQFFKPKDISCSDRKYAFPLGFINMLYSLSEPGEKPRSLSFLMEFVLIYTKEKHDVINKILSELDNFPELNWREIEFELGFRFNPDVLDNICKESGGELKIKSLDPAFNKIVVHIQEWGFAEFKNTEKGASILVYPLNPKECLKQDFFEKINPTTLFRYFGKSFKRKRKVSEEIRDLETDSYLPPRVKRSIPKELIPTIELIQKCFKHELHQCCPPFIRKALENAISIRFKEDGKEHKIVDAQGRRVTLPRLIELAVQEKYLSQNVSKQLLQTKTFGDIAVHDVEIQIDRADVVHDLRNLRLALEQMYPEKGKKAR